MNFTDMAPHKMQVLPSAEARSSGIEGTKSTSGTGLRNDSAEDPQPRKKPLALIADDDLMSRILMRESLENAGFRVEDAENGSLALCAFDRLHPDIVLMDVVMPEMDGISACAALRKMPGGERIPVLMVTGMEDQEAIRRAYEAGATDFITKPINWMILAQRVRYMLRASRTYDELCQSKISLTEAQRIARLGNWEWHVNSNVFNGSDEVYRIYGLKPHLADSTYQAFLERIHPDDLSALAASVKAILLDGSPFSLDHRILLPDGTERIVHQQAEATLDKAGRPVRITGTTQDISQRKRTEEQIKYLAYHDMLTGLPNRYFFKSVLKKELAQAKRHGKMVGLFFLDLDQFKHINDTFGHDAGDHLLHQVAHRIVQCVRKGDSLSRLNHQEIPATVTRFGGDEFAVMLTDIKRIEDAARVARRILDVLAKPFEINAQEMFIGASIGIAVYPAGGKDADSLLKNADAAMYHAKDQGRNNYQFYSGPKNSRALEGLVQENKGQ